MGCGTSKKRANYKSCVRYYNNAIQTLTTDDTTQIVIAGARVADTGISIEAQPSSYTILTRGLYHISGDIVINATTAGNATFAAYMDGVVLPCTFTNHRLAAGNNEIHFETDILIDSCCCDVNKTITFAVILDATAVGSVTHVCTGIIKEA